jgi:hypothetical protein
MCGIGSLVSAWNASQRAIRSEFPNDDHRMGASGLVSALQDSTREMAHETGGTSDGRASLLNPASMAALIVEQTRSSARASLGAFLLSQAEGSACGGPANGRDVFAALDSDGDGMISRSEFDAALNPGGVPTATSTQGQNGTGEPQAPASDQSDASEADAPGPVATSESAAGDEATPETTAGSNAETCEHDSAAVTLCRLPIESVLATLIRLQAHITETTAG